MCSVEVLAIVVAALVEVLAVVEVVAVVVLLAIVEVLAKVVAALVEVLAALAAVVAGESFIVIPAKYSNKVEHNIVPQHCGVVKDNH